MQILKDFNTILIIVWSLKGAATGLLLNWWQWVSINKSGTINRDKILTKVYMISAVRILVVIGIFSISLFNNPLYGFCFLAAFIGSRYFWTFFILKNRKR